MVLEKTLESHLNSKEIKPVNPKGNQPWMFIGRTDTKAESPKVWPPDVKSQLIGKDPDAGKDWRQKEKGATEDEMVRWHHWLKGDSGGERSLACCSPRGRKELDTTEQLNASMRQSQPPSSSHPTPCPPHFSASLGKQGLGFRKREGWWEGSYFVSVWFLCKPFTLLLHGQDSCSGGGSDHTVGRVVLLTHHWWVRPVHSPRSRHILTQAMWTWTAYFTPMSLFPYLEIKDNDNDNSNTYLNQKIQQLY